MIHAEADVLSAVAHAAEAELTVEAVGAVLEERAGLSKRRRRRKRLELLCVVRGVRVADRRVSRHVRPMIAGVAMLASAVHTPWLPLPDACYTVSTTRRDVGAAPDAHRCCPGRTDSCQCKRRQSRGKRCTRPTEHLWRRYSRSRRRSSRRQCCTARRRRWRDRTRRSCTSESRHSRR